jgi:hypothetical protein
MKGIFISGIVGALGLLLWNSFLIGEINKFKGVEKELRMKIDMLEGNTKVMEYDLITSRDSIRILNKALDSLIVQ